MNAVNKRDTGHTGIHGRVDVRTYGRTDVRTFDDVMALKPKFLASMGYHILLTIVLRVREHAAPSARAERR